MTKRAAIRALFPERVPLPPAVSESKRVATDYGSRVSIEYAVAKGERVRAFLLLPAGPPVRRAAILASHQHAGRYALGKSEPAGLSRDRMYHYGVELCRVGFVVLCPDHLGFEERRPRNTAGKLLGGRAGEGFLLGDCLLHGSSLAAKYLFDLCQALDVLAAHPQVDPDRLGAIGHSLGGQTALWLAFFDPRVRASFASCGFSTLAAVQAHGIPHNFASYLPGLLGVGDIDDVVASIAPRAFGMSHGARDPLFPLDGVRTVKRVAGPRFRPGHFLAIGFDGPHAFPLAVRRRAYAFLRKHL